MSEAAKELSPEEIKMFDLTARSVTHVLKELARSPVHYPVIASGTIQALVIYCLRHDQLALLNPAMLERLRKHLHDMLDSAFAGAQKAHGMVARMSPDMIMRAAAGEAVADILKEIQAVEGSPP